jgi:hypothetical protein
MKAGNIGSWLDDDSGSLWRVCSASGDWLTIQHLDTGQEQTIQTEDFWLLLDSL